MKSKVKDTTSRNVFHKNYNMSVLCSPSKFIIVHWHQDGTLTRSAQYGCRNNAGFLGTGPQTMHFMARYFRK